MNGEPKDRVAESWRRTKIVYDAVCELQANGDPVVVADLARDTGMTPQSIHAYLRRLGMKAGTDRFGSERGNWRGKPEYDPPAPPPSDERMQRIEQARQAFALGRL